MSDARGQGTYRYQGYYSVPWGIVRHRLSTADRISRTISLGGLRIHDLRSRIITPTRFSKSYSRPGFTLYRIFIVGASCVGAAYGVSEFVVAVWGP